MGAGKHLVRMMLLQTDFHRPSLHQNEKLKLKLNPAPKYNWKSGLASSPGSLSLSVKDSVGSHLLCTTRSAGHLCCFEGHHGVTIIIKRSYTFD